MLCDSEYLLALQFGGGGCIHIFVVVVTLRTFFFFYFCVCVFLPFWGPIPQHMEVPRLGV